jgi:hypothetical protein
VSGRGDGAERVANRFGAQIRRVLKYVREYCDRVVALAGYEARSRPWLLVNAAAAFHPRLRELTGQLVGQKRRRSAVLAGCLPPVGKDRLARWIPQRETPCEQAVSRTSVLSHWREGSESDRVPQDLDQRLGSAAKPIAKR